MAEFIYQEPFPLSEDTTEYRLLTKDYVRVVECDGRKILKIDPKGLEFLAEAAFSDVSFYLRSAHLQKLADILKDPEATDNDKFVAYTMLLNQVVAADGELPTCQDTGTAIVIGKKGEDVYTGANDAEALSKGVYETYRKRNLRYSQVVPFTMNEPAGSDRSVCHAGQSVQLPVHYEGRRFGQQDVPLSADQSAAQRGVADQIHQDSHYGSGNIGMPSVPFGVGHRGYVGRDEPRYGEEGIGRIPRPSAHLWK